MTIEKLVPVFERGGLKKGFLFLTQITRLKWTKGSRESEVCTTLLRIMICFASSPGWTELFHRPSSRLSIAVSDTKNHSGHSSRLVPWTSACFFYRTTASGSPSPLPTFSPKCAHSNTGNKLQLPTAQSHTTQCAVYTLTHSLTRSFTHRLHFGTRTQRPRPRAHFCPAAALH